MNFFPDLDLAQLMGLAVFGFFTGFGATFGTELSKFMIDKIRKNGKALKELGH